MNGTNVLIVSKGHHFDHNAFLAMFDDMAGVNATLVQQPAAQTLLRPDNAGAYDAVLFYDMSGIPGIGLLHDGANDTGIPPEHYRASIEALIERGTGLVLLNHATVSWPLWPLWREITGTSFMLQAGELDGAPVPGSGYRGGHGPHPNPTLRLVPQCEHPVLAGLQDGFEITDEIYLKTAGFERSVAPLLRGDYDFIGENFTPPPLAPARRASELEPSAGQRPDRVGQPHRCEPRGGLGCGGQPGRVRQPRLSAAGGKCAQMGGIRRSQNLGSGKGRLSGPPSNQQRHFLGQHHRAPVIGDRVRKGDNPRILAASGPAPADAAGLVGEHRAGAGRIRQAHLVLAQQRKHLNAVCMVGEQPRTDRKQVSGGSHQPAEHRACGGDGIGVEGLRVPGRRKLDHRSFGEWKAPHHTSVVVGNILEKAHSRGWERPGGKPQIREHLHIGAEARVGRGEQLVAAENRPGTRHETERLGRFA